MLSIKLVIIGFEIISISVIMEMNEKTKYLIVDYITTYGLVFND